MTSSDPVNAPKPSFWARSYAGFVVTAIAVIVFAPTLMFHRVAFDDYWLWGDDSPLRSFDLHTLRTVFFELDAQARRPFGTEYLPIRDVLVAGDMAIWGTSDQGPHVTQVLLYAVSVYGLGMLLVGFGMRRDLAWMSTLLWAVHPLHVETVAWLSERKSILATLFVIASGHAWVRYRGGRSRWWLVLGAVAMIAGVWSKALAMFAPAVFALWDRLLLAASPQRVIAIGVIGGAGMLAAIPVVLVARDAGVVDGAFAIQPDGRITAFIGALGHYTLSLVLARTPSLSYPIQTVGASPLELVVGAASVAVSIAFVLWRRPGRAWRISVLGWAWIFYVPASHLFMRVHIPVADRFAFLWCLGGCIGAAWCVTQLRGPVRVAVFGALVGLLTIGTLRAQQSWTSSFELFANAFRNNPDDPRACENYAEALFGAERIDEAFAVVNRGLAHNPLDPYLLSVKAGFFHAIGDPHALGTGALAAASGHASTMSQYAGILVDAGRPAEALTFAARAARRRPEVPMYTWRLIDLFLEFNRLPQAEAEARALLARYPSSASHMVVARVLVAQHRDAEANLYLVVAQQLGASAKAVGELRAQMTDEDN